MTVLDVLQPRADTARDDAPVVSLDEVSADAAWLARHVAASVVAVHSGRWGSGSGVLWDEPGLVVTNHHVVRGERAEVRFPDGTRLEARLVARDASTDLAALRLEGDAPTSARPAQVGGSAALRVGEVVLAVGNPLGERNAATLGILSGRRQASLDGGAPGEVLQLAITLRPGNSGGALADARGRVVGIPHMVNGPGLGLAVPVEAVRRLLAQASGSPTPPPADGIVWV